MTPAWTISADGTDVTATLAQYLVSLSLTDQAGMESDTLQLVIADPEAVIAMPRIGAVLSVALGYAHTGPVSMGAYTVDTVELANPPRQLTIRAHAADLREGMKRRKTKGWESTTIGEIVTAIASAQGLTPAIGADLADIAVARIDQTNESDISFLTRLGQQYDAIATIKSGRLIFAKRGQGAATSGQPIEAVELSPLDCTSWRISLSETDKYTAAEARYYDRTTASEEWIRSGTGEGEAVLRLRQTFPDRARAKAAADARLAAITRGNATLSLTMPGNTALAAETPVTLAGFAPELDGRWVLTTATHTLDSGGYSTAVEGERAA